MDLEALGYSPFFAGEFAPFAVEGFRPARVAAEHKHIYRLYAELGEFLAEVAGKVRYQASGRQDFPAVGDWVAASLRPRERKATIHGILPRKSKFSRKVAGRNTEEQILAANIDTVFLVNGLDHDFSLRRIERYLIMAWESGAYPVVLLNKADLCDHTRPLGAAIAEVESVAPGVPVHAISCLRQVGMQALGRYLAKGQTVALLGSSGVGKSTIINRLVGKEILRTREVREDDSHGRHTTTYRQLIPLPGGGLVIDTPGMRELQLWDADSGLQGTFEEIESVAAHCRFEDCHHRGEPDCAVRQAVEDGKLSAARLASYHRMQRELAHLARRQDKWSQLAEKKRVRSIHRIARKHKPRL